VELPLELPPDEKKPAETERDSNAVAGAKLPMEWA